MSAFLSYYREAEHRRETRYEREQEEVRREERDKQAELALRSRLKAAFGRTSDRDVFSSLMYDLVDDGAEFQILVAAAAEHYKDDDAALGAYVRALCDKAVLRAVVMFADEQE